MDNHLFGCMFHEKNVVFLAKIPWIWSVFSLARPFGEGGEFFRPFRNTLQNRQNQKKTKGFSGGSLRLGPGKKYEL